MISYEITAPDEYDDGVDAHYTHYDGLRRQRRGAPAAHQLPASLKTGNCPAVPREGP